MFRRSASLAIPHISQKFRSETVPLPSFLGHTNRSVKLPHESQREAARVYQFLTANKEKGGKKNGPVFRRVCAFDVSRAVGIARFRSVSKSQPHRTMQCQQAGAECRKISDIRYCAGHFSGSRIAGVLPTGSYTLSLVSAPKRLQFKFLTD